VKYSAEDYLFPEAFVEGVESNKYMIVDLKDKKYTIANKPEGDILLGQVIYEQATSLALNLIQSKTTRRIAIRVPWKNGKAMLLNKDERIVIYEISGLQVVFSAHEGDDVNPGDTLAYVLTGKGETRTIRVEEEATVFYISWLPGTYPPTYIVVLAYPQNLIILEEAV